MKNLTYVFNDTETTGIGEEDRLIESAHAHVNANSNKLIKFVEELCSVGDLEIDPGAGMTHGYTYQDIQDKVPFSETESYKDLTSFAKDPNCYYVAHNAPFDIGMLKKDGVEFDKSRVIDTLKLAKHLLDRDLRELPIGKYIFSDKEKFDKPQRFALQYFRYYFLPYFEKKEPKYMKMFGVEEIRPHTALSDILVLWIFMDLLVEEFGLSQEEMVRLTQTPALEQTISFGSVFERGTPYEEIIESTYFQGNRKKNGYEYLLWAAFKMDNLPIDREYSLKYYLAYATLNKKIPLNDETKRCLKWAITYVFKEDECKDAARMLFMENNIKDRLLQTYEKWIEIEIEKSQNLIKELDDPNEAQKLNKLVYFKEYYETFRKDFLNKIFS